MFNTKRWGNKMWGKWNPIGPNIIADMWQNFEFSGTVDSTNLGANDHTSIGSWSVSDASTLLSTSASAERATLSTVNGSADSGTYGLIRSFSALALANVTYDWGSNVSACSVGHWFRFTQAPANTHRLWRVTDGLGNTPLYVRINTSSYIEIEGGGNNGAALSINTWYWITFQAVKGGTSTCRVYDSSGVQVGSDATYSSPNNNIRYLVLFGENSQINEAGLSIYIDDIVTDFTSATFPLGP